MLKAAKAYLSTQVSTASQGDLLVMLYDTAIKHLNLSIEKMRAGDMAGKGILISKAISIVSELQECLNKERGGEISENLFQIYFYCNTRLLKANLKVQPEMVEEVITILSGLRQAFAQILPTQEGVASLTQAEASASAPIAAPTAPAPVAQAPAAQSYAPAANVHAPAGYPQPGAQTMPQPVPAAQAQQAPAPVHAAAGQEMPSQEASVQEMPVAPSLLPTAPEPTPVQNAPVPAANTLRFRAANAYATSR